MLLRLLLPPGRYGLSHCNIQPIFSEFSYQCAPFFHAKFNKAISLFTGNNTCCLLSLPCRQKQPQRPHRAQGRCVSFAKTCLLLSLLSGVPPRSHPSRWPNIQQAHRASPCPFTFFICSLQRFCPALILVPSFPLSMTAS